MEIRNLFGEMKQKIVGKRLRIVFLKGLMSALFV